MSAADRIAALEAEVAELRAFLPMLARMAFYEVWSGRSMPEHVITFKDLLVGSGLAWVDVLRHEERDVEIRVGGLAEDEDEFVRPKDEGLPGLAQHLQDSSNERFRQVCARHPS